MIAIGTSQGTILLYSISKASLHSQLVCPHTSTLILVHRRCLNISIIHRPMVTMIKSTIFAGAHFIATPYIRVPMMAISLNGQLSTQNLESKYPLK